MSENNLSIVVNTNLSHHSDPKWIVFVTGNANKLKEVKAILSQSSNGFKPIEINSKDVDSTLLPITVSSSSDGRTDIFPTPRSARDPGNNGWSSTRKMQASRWTRESGFPSHDVCITGDLRKGRAVSSYRSQINGPCITEDTALCFKAFNGLPGPYIKHFLKALGHEGEPQIKSSRRNGASFSFLNGLYFVPGFLTRLHA